MEIKTRDLSLTIIFGSLYVVMVFFFAPISFYSIQFRVAGVLRPAIAKKSILAIGYAIGVAISNFLSPFIGVYELIFMPFMSLIAGLTGFIISKRFNKSYFVTGIVIAIIIPLSVSWMLNQLFSIPIIVSLPGIFISELSINMIGAVMFRMIEQRYRWWE